MEFKNIIGINTDGIQWKFSCSLFLALMFPSCFTYFATLSGKVHYNIFNDLVYIPLLIGLPILIYKFLKIKNELVNIVIIAILCAGLSQFILSQIYSNYSFPIYSANILASICKTLLLILCWVIMIRNTGKRKLSLVIGYFITIIIIIISYVYFHKMQNKNLEISDIFFMILGHIIKTFEFWIGLLIFDKIFKI